MQQIPFWVLSGGLAFLLLANCPDTSRAHEPLLLTSGRIEVIDRARLACDQMGIISRDIPREGTVVKAGEVVVFLDDQIPKAALAAAEVLASNDADVRAKENASQLAQVEYDRALAANQRTPGTVPELEVRRLELTQKQAVLEKEQAEKELELNQRRRDQSAALLDAYSVKAPFSGSVTRVMRHRGEAVRQGEPILELISVDRVRIALEVPLHLREQLELGMEVLVSPEKIASLPAIPLSENVSALSEDAVASRGPGRKGKITFIDPVAEVLSRTIRVYVVVEDNTDQYLVAGLGATVELPDPRVVQVEAPAK